MSKTKYMLNICSPYLTGDSFLLEHRAGDDWLLVRLSPAGEEVGRCPHTVMFKEVNRKERNLTN